MSTREESELVYKRLVLKNLSDARENGYDLACPICGCGLADDSDMHDDTLHRVWAQAYPEQAAQLAEDGVS